MTGKTEGARSRPRLSPSRFALFSILLSEGTSNAIAGCEVLDARWEQNVSAVSRQAQLMGISETVAAPAPPGRPYNKDSQSLCLILARRVPTVKRIKRGSKGQPQPLLLKRDGENWETLPACTSRPSRISRPSRVKHTMRAVEDQLASPQERIQKSGEHCGEKRRPGYFLTSDAGRARPIGPPISEL